MYMSEVLSLIILLWVMLAGYVWNHAEKHGRNGLAWFLFVLVTGVLGMVIYLFKITNPGANVIDTQAQSPASQYGESSIQQREALFYTIEDTLRNQNVITDVGLKKMIYPNYTLGYNSPQDWWNELVRPELEDRQKFERLDEFDNAWKLSESYGVNDGD